KTKSTDGQTSARVQAAIMSLGRLIAALYRKAVSSRSSRNQRTSSQRLSLATQAAIWLDDFQWSRIARASELGVCGRSPQINETSPAGSNRFLTITISRSLREV